MKKKDILELKKRLKKDKCTFTKMCGCYVNGEKNIILKFRETFLNLDEDEYFKYLEIAKKVLSGTIGNNILDLNFPLNTDLINEKQLYLMKLKNSQLKDDIILDEFYNSIINNYDYTGNFLILIFHDAYDVITKTRDNLKLDESEEVYEYILCAICPVSLSEPGLRYFENENKIKSRIRDWIVENPTHGFVFPAFIDRSSDVNSVMYYTKNAKDIHPELMENVLGCYSKQTATIQKETFEAIIKESFSADENKANRIFMEVQENLNNMINDYNSMYDDINSEPINLTTKDIENILIESDIPEDIASKIEKSYVKYFGDDMPLAENLLDTKALKANEQRKKEEHLQNQVEILKNRLEEVKKEVLLDNKSDISNNTTSEDSLEIALEKDENSDLNNNYDIILEVSPKKISQIKSEIINGQKCIVIPINENEQTKVNGLDNLI